MEENCNYFLVYGEKNPHKFSIELEHSNTNGLSKPQFSIDKISNCSADEKPSINFSSKKTNSINSTNIFQITNIKDNNANDNNKYALSTKVIENNDFKSLYEQKQMNNISKENENSDSNQNEYNTGRWTNEEHEKFIEGILKFGNEWKRVQSIIKTRSSTQARSHAQKFFLRMKKEISPNIISDQNLLIQYIINTSNNFKNYTELTQEQKEKLFSVIRSNLKPDEIQNKSNKDIQSINEDNKQFEQKMEINNEEYDDLAYYKYNNINQNTNETDNKRKITFCSKKRKSSSDLLLSTNSNKIFNISKDINHKKSMEISKTNNFMNKSTLQNIDEDQNQYNLNNLKKINKINNNYIINNNNINNNNFINNENLANKPTNLNNYYGNTNFIIQNNYYNIINNFNNNSNINNIHNTYMSNDSFNSDINNHNYKVFNCDNCKNKEKNNKNNSESMDFEKNININSKNIFENYTFLNNENFFPQLNKNECEQNDPFNLKFENEIAHNDNIIMNDNIYLNNNIEEGHEIDDYESNIDKNNYCDRRPYDD